MARTARERIDGDPASTAALAALLEKLNEIGPFAVEEKQTSFHIVNGRAFLGVHPRKNGLLINIVLDHPVDSPRLHRAEHVSASRWHNEFLVSSPSDIDAELVACVAAAHRLTQ